MLFIKVQSLRTLIILLKIVHPFFGFLTLRAGATCAKERRNDSLCFHKLINMKKLTGVIVNLSFFLFSSFGRLTYIHTVTTKIYKGSFQEGIGRKRSYL